MDLLTSSISICFFITSRTNVDGAIHIICYINRLTTTKVDLFGLLNEKCTAFMSVAGLERITTNSSLYTNPASCFNKLQTVSCNSNLSLSLIFVYNLISENRNLDIKTNMLKMFRMLLFL